MSTYFFGCHLVPIREIVWFQSPNKVNKITYSIQELEIESFNGTICNCVVAVDETFELLEDQLGLLPCSKKAKYKGKGKLRHTIAALAHNPQNNLA